MGFEKNPEFKLFWALKGYENVNYASFKIGDYESLKEAAIEPYEAIRNAYIQFRRKKIME